jgi:hypothetical protein
MLSYKLESVKILQRDCKRDVKSASYMAVIVSEQNEKWVIHGYDHSLDKISLEYCGWSALQYFIGENTASYRDFEIAYDRILSPWESFEL